ncbi:MAG TPA: response regulator [Gemmataceae bacterium]|jgi:CheY-like chemotaxis protein|nr:response regulator [Gemmataceae bacterium]
MLRVLVVDDHSDSAESLAMMLRLYGYTVDVAKTSKSGLEAVETNWPDAVLLDIGLPFMDGFEVAKQIQLKSIARRKPLLIAVTGYGEESVRLRCLAEGFDRHLLKPVSPSEMLEILAATPPADDFSEAS